MARSLIQRRQEAERERLADFDASLRRVSAARRPAPDFEKALKQAKKGFETFLVRDAWDWHPRMKTRDAARLRLAAARHLFARYPVAAPLERIWLDSDGLDGEEIKLRKRWYIAVARGDSLYKAGARDRLSRKEVHAFLNAPDELSFDAALWLAVASSFTADRGVALRIAGSKIARTARRDFAFWREAARFFCVNQTTVEEIDDLSDFLAARHQREPGYSLKGRTLGSLRRQMQEWHRDLAEVARIEAARRRARQAAGGVAEATARWSGAQLANWAWQPSDKAARNRREEYLVVQLASAEDLVAESRAMHHCVSSYAHKCITGQASIWSLRLRSQGTLYRLLTIELDRQGRAVQVRGFANRLAKPEEKQVLGRWAKACGVALLA